MPRHLRREVDLAMKTPIERFVREAETWCASACTSWDVKAKH